MNPCPFCDHDAADMQDLVEHVLDKHANEMVGGFSLATGRDTAQYGAYGVWVVCWCERLFGVNPGKVSLAHHWQSRGGLAAHLLELALFQKGRR